MQKISCFSKPQTKHGKNVVGWIHSSSSKVLLQYVLDSQLEKVMENLKPLKQTYQFQNDKNLIFKKLLLFIFSTTTMSKPVKYQDRLQIFSQANVLVTTTCNVEHWY